MHKKMPFSGATVKYVHTAAQPAPPPILHTLLVFPNSNSLPLTRSWAVKVRVQWFLPQIIIRGLCPIRVSVLKTSCTVSAP